eukprot:gene11099-17061_t
MARDAARTQSLERRLEDFVQFCRKAAHRRDGGGGYATDDTHDVTIVIEDEAQSARPAQQVQEVSKESRIAWASEVPAAAPAEEHPRPGGSPPKEPAPLAPHDGNPPQPAPPAPPPPPPPETGGAVVLSAIPGNSEHVASAVPPAKPTHRVAWGAPQLHTASRSTSRRKKQDAQEPRTYDRPPAKPAPRRQTSVPVGQRAGGARGAEGQRKRVWTGQTRQAASQGVRRQDSPETAVQRGRQLEQASTQLRRINDQNASRATWDVLKVHREGSPEPRHVRQKAAEAGAALSRIANATRGGWDAPPGVTRGASPPTNGRSSTPPAARERAKGHVGAAAGLQVSRTQTEPIAGPATERRGWGQGGQHEPKGQCPDPGVYRVAGGRVEKGGAGEACLQLYASGVASRRERDLACAIAALEKERAEAQVAVRQLRGARRTTSAHARQHAAALHGDARAIERKKRDLRLASERTFACVHPFTPTITPYPLDPARRRAANAAADDATSPQPRPASPPKRPPPFRFGHPDHPLPDPSARRARSAGGSAARAKSRSVSPAPKAPSGSREDRGRRLSSAPSRLSRVLTGLLGDEGGAGEGVGRATARPEDPRGSTAVVPAQPPSPAGKVLPDPATEDLTGSFAQADGGPGEKAHDGVSRREDAETDSDELLELQAYATVRRLNSTDTSDPSADGSDEDDFSARDASEHAASPEFTATDKSANGTFAFTARTSGMHGRRLRRSGKLAEEDAADARPEPTAAESEMASTLDGCEDQPRDERSPALAAAVEAPVRRSLTSPGGIPPAPAGRGLSVSPRGAVPTSVPPLVAKRIFDNSPFVTKGPNLQAKDPLALAASMRADGPLGRMEFFDLDSAEMDVGASAGGVTWDQFMVLLHKHVRAAQPGSNPALLARSKTALNPGKAAALGGEMASLKLSVAKLRGGGSLATLGRAFFEVIGPANACVARQEMTGPETVVDVDSLAVRGYRLISPSNDPASRDPS